MLSIQLHSRDANHGQEPWGRWPGAWAPQCGDGAAAAQGQSFWGRFLGREALRRGAACRWQAAAAGAAQVAVPRGQGCLGATCPAMRPPTPDLLELPATMGTRGIKMPQNQGLRGFCSALSQGQPSPGI